MIRLTASGKINYQMFNQIVVLLIIYACFMLLSAIQALPSAPRLPMPLVHQFTDRILHLTLLTGMVTAGMSMSQNNQQTLPYQQWLYRLWWILIIGTLLIGGIEIASSSQASSVRVDLSSTPTMMSILIDLCVSLLLFTSLGISAYCKTASPFLRVWQIGMMFTISSLLAQFVVNGNWETVVRLFRVYVGYGVVGISITFWLMTRWSHVRAIWARDGVTIVASLISLSGLLISFAPLGLHPWIGFLAVWVIPISYMILAGHSYRALKDRNHNQSLSPHWIAIAILFWLAVGGFLGTISTQGGLPIWIQDTSIASAQIGWMLWGLLAIILALVNYQAAELRGENRRVTGYMPLWLMAFGNGFALIIQGCIGVVEIYLLKILHIHRPHIDVLLVPLHMIWIVCLLAVALGIGLYALGFWVRRPKKITVDG